MSINSKMHILHFCDLNVCSSSMDDGRLSSTIDRLHVILQHENLLNRFDAVVAFGDLTENGQPASRERAEGILDELASFTLKPEKSGQKRSRLLIVSRISDPRDPLPVVRLLKNFTLVGLDVPVGLDAETAINSVSSRLRRLPGQYIQHRPMIVACSENVVFTAGERIRASLFCVDQGVDACVHYGESKCVVVGMGRGVNHENCSRFNVISLNSGDADNRKPFDCLRYKRIKLRASGFDNNDYEEVYYPVPRKSESTSELDQSGFKPFLENIVAHNRAGFFPVQAMPGSGINDYFPKPQESGWQQLRNIDVQIIKVTVDKYTQISDGQLIIPRGILGFIRSRLEEPAPPRQEEEPPARRVVVVLDKVFENVENGSALEVSRCIRNEVDRLNAIVVYVLPPLKNLHRFREPNRKICFGETSEKQLREGTEGMLARVPLFPQHLFYLSGGYYGFTKTLFERVIEDFEQLPESKVIDEEYPWNCLFTQAKSLYYEETISRFREFVQSLRGGPHLLTYVSALTAARLQSETSAQNQPEIAFSWEAFHRVYPSVRREEFDSTIEVLEGFGVFKRDGSEHCVNLKLPFINGEHYRVLVSHTEQQHNQAEELKYKLESLGRTRHANIIVSLCEEGRNSHDQSRYDQIRDGVRNTENLIVLYDEQDCSGGTFYRLAYAFWLGLVSRCTPSENACIFVTDVPNLSHPGMLSTDVPCTLNSSETPEGLARIFSELKPYILEI